MSVVDDLASLAIFADLPHEQIERLAKYAEELDVEAGEELTHEGRHEGPVFAVISGTIGIERGGRVVDTIGPGGFFGEIAAIDGGARTATGGRSRTPTSWRSRRGSSTTSSTRCRSCGSWPYPHHRNAPRSPHTTKPLLPHSSLHLSPPCLDSHRLRATISTRARRARVPWTPRCCASAGRHRCGAAVTHRGRRRGHGRPPSSRPRRGSGFDGGD